MLAQAEAAETPSKEKKHRVLALCVVCVLPLWASSPAIRAARSCQWARAELILDGDSHAYLDGFQHKMLLGAWEAFVIYFPLPSKPYQVMVCRLPET